MVFGGIDRIDSYSAILVSSSFLRSYVFTPNFCMRKISRAQASVSARGSKLSMPTFPEPPGWYYDKSQECPWRDTYICSFNPKLEYVSNFLCWSITISPVLEFTKWRPLTVRVSIALTKENKVAKTPSNCAKRVTEKNILQPSVTSAKNNEIIWSARRKILKTNTESNQNF